MQTDPIGYSDGINWYDYVDGDPVNFLDSTGEGKSRGPGERGWTGSPDKPEKMKTRPIKGNPNQFEVQHKQTKQWTKKSIKLAAKYGFKAGARLIPFVGWAWTLYDSARSLGCYDTVDPAKCLKDVWFEKKIKENETDNKIDTKIMDRKFKIKEVIKFDTNDKRKNGKNI